MFFRAHGPAGEASVVVLHGGPGVAGSAGGLARALADPYRVLEPWQRGSGGQPLTVATHVADLREFCAEHCPWPHLVGHSWGAMLALAYAAEHPVRSVVLVCSGTFDAHARAAFKRELTARTAGTSLDALADDDRMRALDRAYGYDLLPDDPLDHAKGDRRANQETWADMLRLQAEGKYPAAFAAIAAPVRMIHGSHDPHPGTLIRDSLKPHLPQLEYRELVRCGHSPWRERQARDAFVRTLVTWLRAR